MPRLKIILQSKAFLIGSLVFLGLYLILFTKVIKYNSCYNLDDYYLEGTILNYKIDGDKLSILLKAKEKVQVNYYINSKEEKNNLQNNLKLGLKVKLKGNMATPANNTIPNTFNYKEYLYHNKIYYTFTASELEIEKTKINIFYQIKNSFRKRVTKFKMTSDYLYAFILGDNDYITEDVYKTYQNNGVTHLFAVSGMHITFLVGFMQYILKKLRVKENIRNIVIIGFLGFYMFLVGFSASVMRASLLFIFLIINKKLRLNLETSRVLYILFLILLLINPFYIYNLGFIYSFLTSFGLIIFAKKIKGNYFKKLLLVSLIALLFSLPVTLLNFYEFNILTILNNLIIVPLVSLILFPLSLLTFLCPFLEIFLNLGFNILEKINLFLDTFKINIIVPKINIFFIIIYYGLIYLIYKKGFKCVVGIGLLIFAQKVSPYLDFNNYVYYLDVGQGDSSLIMSANHQDIILIDTGGVINYQKDAWKIRNNNFNLADNIILFFKSLGINKIDLLVISHGDLDHIGYAKDIKENLAVKKMMFNNNSYNSNEQAIIDNNSKIIKNEYIGKKVTIKNLNTLINSNENDSSLVLKVNLAGHNLLYMGDAPKKVEEQVRNDYHFNCDILKLGHHGSNTSSDEDFLKAFNPKLSIISAGRNNRYNHPHKETIATLNNLNLEYYSTKEKGTIEVILDKKIIFYAP